MSITYTSLTRTNYPDALDDRPDAVEVENRNPHFALNVNFEDRTSSTNPQDYYVLADDINALQDAIIAIQRSLGVKPQGDNGLSTVAERFLNLENYVMLGDSTNSGFNDLDERYMWGGTRPTINGQPAPLVSIVSHLHDGTPGQATKIDLANHVTGLLSKNNIDLTSNTTDMLSAQDIRMSTSDSTTIPQKLDTKYDKAGGEISGDVKISGNIQCGIFFEKDAKDMGCDTDKGYQISTVDYYANSGYARKADINDLDGYLINETISMRYGYYSVILRMKIPTTDSSKNSNMLCRISLLNKKTGELTTQIITVGDFSVQDEYQNIYVNFNHRNDIGAVGGAQEFDLKVYYYSGVTPLYIDSVVIVPVGIATYYRDEN